MVIYVLKSVDSGGSVRGIENDSQFQNLDDLEKRNEFYLFYSF